MLHCVLTQTQICYTMYLHKHRFVTLCTYTNTDVLHCVLTQTQICYTMYLHKHRCVTLCTYTNTDLLHCVLTQYTNTDLLHCVLTQSKNTCVTLCTHKIHKHRFVTLCTYKIPKHKFVTTQAVYVLTQSTNKYLLQFSLCIHMIHKKLLIQSYYHVFIGELDTYRGFHDKSIEDKGNI